MKIPDTPPSFDELIRTLPAEALHRALEAGVKATDDGAYRHWDTIRRMEPPGGLNLKEWWLALKVARRPLLRPVPLKDADNRAFQYAVPDSAAEMLHHIDQDASGQISFPELVANPGTRSQYLVRSLMEEAITSSQLEGASTAHRVAKEMLQTGRAPRTRDEQMILNNFRAMQEVRGWNGIPLTPEMVLGLHETVTEGTLDNPAAAGRLQGEAEERVVVRSRDDGRVVHVPPPASELPKRLEMMCQFANGGLVDGFMHPVIRAVLLHFWLAYDHPFEDGNGRTARALFYWSMSTQGYWLTEFLSISRILNKAPSQYARSFLYTETDDRDVTYFLLYQLEVMTRAIRDMHSYLQRKAAEVRQIEQLIRGTTLNHRQVELLSHAANHPEAMYTYAGHATAHRVVRQSARTDILELESLDLLERRTGSKQLQFRPAQDLTKRLAELQA